MVAENMTVKERLEKMAYMGLFANMAASFDLGAEHPSEAAIAALIDLSRKDRSIECFWCSMLDQLHELGPEIGLDTNEAAGVRSYIDNLKQDDRFQSATN